MEAKEAQEAQQGNPIKMLPNMAEVQGLVVSSVQGAAEFWIREQQIALALAADCTKKKDIRAGSFRALAEKAHGFAVEIIESANKRLMERRSQGKVGIVGA